MSTTMSTPMKDIKELAHNARLLCYEIEKLPASEQQTRASVMASELLQDIVNLAVAREMRKRDDLYDAFISGGLIGYNYEVPDTSRGMSFGEYLSKEFTEFLKGPKGLE